LLRRLTNALNIDVPRLASDPFPARASRRRVAASPPTTSTLRARVPSRVSLAVPVARDRDAARSPRRGAFAASIAARARRRARRRRALSSSRSPVDFFAFFAVGNGARCRSPRCGRRDES
jgi:hypothetical protein